MADVQPPEPSPSPEIPDGPRETPPAEESQQLMQAPPNENDEQLKAQLEKVTLSDVGLTALLGRLKQSIASARDFAAFLKKRSIIEQEHAEDLKKLSRATHDSIRRPEHRQGSYAGAYEEIVKIQDGMSEHGLQFALSLHQMSDDLQDLGANVERGRKHWKQVGTNAEKRVLDAENAMDKAKSKYDSLAEQYDRARTGDRQSGRFGLKGPKSAAQQEEDLLKKLQAADADYLSKVQAAKSQRQELISTLRPQFTKSLQDLIFECDSGVTLQMQKFATFNEKLLLGNGLIVSPLKNQTNGAGAQPRSLRDVVRTIDNTTDFNRYVLGFTGQSSPRIGEIKYEQHPTLRPAKQTPTPAVSSFNAQPSQPPPRTEQQPSTPGNAPPHSPYNRPPSSGAPQIGQLSGVPPSSQGHPPSGRDFSGPPPAGRDFSGPPTSGRDFSGPPPSGRDFSGPPPSQHGPSYGRPPSQTRDPYQPQPSPDYRSQPSQSSPMLPQMPAHEPLSLSGGVPLASYRPNGHHTPSGPQPPSGHGNNQLHHLPPTNPVFGVSLEELFRRDGSAVPMIVYQCIQAVDMFGLEVEGIYRTSGSNPHIMEMKQMFDHDSSSLDFRDPSTFSHDISSVAGLIKLFFRSLPNPLLTSAHYSEFISAAQIPDDVLRRDSLHAIINALPDPNYATLRILMLHLNRVQQRHAVNRMTAQNLAIVWGPTLMSNGGAGAGPGPAAGPMGDIRDAGWQAKVVETILLNTLQIFDDDE